MADKQALLDKEAKVAVPPVSSNKSPKEYFALGAGYLKMAGQCKKAGDYQGAYLNLSKYIILITERLAGHKDVKVPPYKDEYLFNVQKCEMMKKELGVLALKFGGSPRKNPPPPPARRKAPPPPKKKSSGWSFFGSSKSKEIEKPSSTDVVEDVSDLNMQERVAYRAVGTVVHNDRFQERMGESVANIAMNDKVQGRVADGVATASMNTKYQKAVGNMIADNTENSVLKHIARNEKMQKAVGTSLAKTVGNKELQQKAGRAVAKAATDKRVQKAAATGFMMGVRGAVKGGKFFGKVAYSGTKMAVKEGIDYHKNQKRNPPPPPKK